MGPVCSSALMAYSKVGIRVPLMLTWNWELGVEANGLKIIRKDLDKNSMDFCGELADGQDDWRGHGQLALSPASS
jgi:hypothetical protein